MRHGPHRREEGALGGHGGMRTGLILGRAGTGTTAALWQAALGSGREDTSQGRHGMPTGDGPEPDLRRGCPNRSAARTGCIRSCQRPTPRTGRPAAHGAATAAPPGPRERASQRQFLPAGPKGNQFCTATDLTGDSRRADRAGLGVCGGS